MLYEKQCGFLALLLYSGRIVVAINGKTINSNRFAKNEMKMCRLLYQFESKLLNNDRKYMWHGTRSGFFFLQILLRSGEAGFMTHEESIFNIEFDIFSGLKWYIHSEDFSRNNVLRRWIDIFCWIYRINAGTMRIPTQTLDINSG